MVHHAEDGFETHAVGDLTEGHGREAVSGEGPVGGFAANGDRIAEGSVVVEENGAAHGSMMPGSDRMKKRPGADYREETASLVILDGLKRSKITWVYEKSPPDFAGFLFQGNLLPGNGSRSEYPDLL